MIKRFRPNHLMRAWAVFILTTPIPITGTGTEPLHERLSFKHFAMGIAPCAA